MIRANRFAATTFLAALAGLAVVCAVQADPPVKDVKSLLPARKHAPVKGNVVGILLYDAQPVLSTEGRSGPADQLCFSVSGNSYRWVYVPVTQNAQITNLQVPVGDMGQIQVYPMLDMARPKTVKAMGVDTLYSLVQVEVNNGQGSPAGDSFVATQFRVLDGSKEFPLSVAKSVDDMKARFAAFMKDQGQKIEAAMQQSAQVALPNQEKITGPREQQQLMYVTWIPETERLQIRFSVKITDGSYTITEVPGGPRKGPFPLPPPPLKEVPPPPANNNQQPAQQQVAPAEQPILVQQGGAGQPPGPPQPPGGPGGFQPPPREAMRLKSGMSFGIEFGVVYEIDKNGKLVETQVLEPAPFQARVQQQFGGGGLDIDMPPPPLKLPRK